MFDVLFDGLAAALAYLYDLVPSYAGAIALFSLAIMLVVSPLSIKSTRSMIRMQRVQPELKRLQQQYKGDREALNREMMAFYQANNINPLASCLPMLLQMPIFIVLYQVLSGLTRKASNGTFDPKYLDHDSSLYQALHGADEMLSVGLDLSRSATTILSDSGVAEALPYFLLVGIVAVTTWYQQRQIAGRNPDAAANPQQQMITKIMPFVMIPITISVPAGVVIYFVVSNLVRVGQQALVTRLEYGEGKSFVPVVPPPASAPATPPAGPGAATGRTAGSGRVTPRGQTPQRKKKRK